MGGASSWLIVVAMVMAVAGTSSSSSASAATTPTSTTMRLRMLSRRQRDPRQLLLHDAVRLSSSPPFRMRRRNFGLPETAAPESAQLPLASAAKFGTAFYFVEAHVGTPPQRLLLAADTGSDLIWAKCATAAAGTSESAAAADFPIFSPENSSTAAYVSCFSDECAALSGRRGADNCIYRPVRACRFSYSYKGGGAVSGPYLRDTLTLTVSAGGVTARGLYMGCGTRMPGFSATAFGGVLGLGRGFTSFPAQTRQLFGGVFSYCLAHYLGPTSSDGALIFGATAAAAAGLEYTPMLDSPAFSNFYYLGIDGISLAGKPVAVPLDRIRLDEHGNGGAIIDSGTSLTYLEDDVYKAVIGSLRKHVPYPTATSADPAGFELCFNVSGADKEQPAFPEMAVLLGGGVVLRVPPENYVLRVEEGVSCVGLMRVSWPSPTIIGALLHQNYLVQYDLNRSLLGFGYKRC